MSMSKGCALSIYTLRDRRIRVLPFKYSKSKDTSIISYKLDETRVRVRATERSKEGECTRLTERKTNFYHSSKQKEVHSTYVCNIKE